MERKYLMTKSNDEQKGVIIHEDICNGFLIIRKPAGIPCHLHGGKVGFDKVVWDATPLLDSALQTVLPGSLRSVTELAPNQQLIDQTLSGLAVLGTFDFAEATTLAIALEGATPDTARGQLAPALTSSVTTNLQDLGSQLALADTTTIEELLLRQADSAGAPVPVVSFDAEPSSVEAGTSTRLSWAASDADIAAMLRPLGTDELRLEDTP